MVTTVRTLHRTAVAASARRVRGHTDSTRRPGFAELLHHPHGPFIRAACCEVDAQRELAVGQWGVIPWFAKEANLTYSTNNARFEGIEVKASFKQSWARGQRCIISATTFDEPNWESGKNVWWRLRRADGAPWGLAGLRNTWTDQATGELIESDTMLTLNADAHPLMRRMHKPDPKLGPTEQDKRLVVAIDFPDVDTWLHGTVAQAALLVTLAPKENSDAGSIPR